MHCRSTMLPTSTAADSPLTTPEQEDGSAETTKHQAPPSHQLPLNAQGVSQQRSKASSAQGDSTSEEMDIDVVGDDAPAMSMSSKPNDSQPVASQTVGPSTVTAAGQAAAGTASQQRQQGNAKPDYIPRGAQLPKRSLIRRSHGFADADSVKAALANAWSQDSDVGKQLAALYELFGGAILPYVPMLPCLSHPL